VGAVAAEEVTGVEETGAAAGLCFELDTAGVDCDGLCEGVLVELGVCGETGACGDVGPCAESGASEAAGVSTGVDVSAGEGVCAGVGVSTGLTVSGGLGGSALGVSKGAGVSVGFPAPRRVSIKSGAPPTWDNSVGNKPGKKTDSDGP
jgi:hypothetical protein